MSPSAPRVVTRRAHAKVNVFLRVLGRRDDGFHDLESVVLPISLHDVVTATEAAPGELSIQVEGDAELARLVSTVPGENLAGRAVEALARRVGRDGPSRGVSLRLDKRIPVAAGLGGGSADAAAALLAADEVWSCDLGAPALAELGAELGSDVPAMLAREPVLASGRGELIITVHAASIWWVLKPLGFGVSAADAYAWWDDAPVTGPDPGVLIAALEIGDVELLGDALFNDLQPGVRRAPLRGGADDRRVPRGRRPRGVHERQRSDGGCARQAPRPCRHARGRGTRLDRGERPARARRARTGGVIDPVDRLPRADVIETERLRLTPLVPDDADAVFPMLDDERLHAFTGGRPDTIEELRARLAAWATERSPDGQEAWLNWLARSLEDGRVLGTTQATVERDHGDLRAAVAWTIGSADQGRGVGSEAARAIVGWLAGEGVTIIEAYVHPEHGASAGVARNAGMVATDEIVDGEVVWRRSTARTADAG